MNNKKGNIKMLFYMNLLNIPVYSLKFDYLRL